VRSALKSKAGLTNLKAYLLNSCEKNASIYANMFYDGKEVIVEVKADLARTLLQAGWKYLEKAAKHYLSKVDDTGIRQTTRYTFGGYFNWWNKQAMLEYLRNLSEISPLMY